MRNVVSDSKKAIVDMAQQIGFKEVDEENMDKSIELY
jgi:hypothetical protein